VWSSGSKPKGHKYGPSFDGDAERRQARTTMARSMKSRLGSLSLVILVSASLVAACGGDARDLTSPGCSPGTESACECDDGMGTRSCNSRRIWGECNCGEDPRDPSGGSAGDTGSGGDSKSGGKSGSGGKANGSGSGGKPATGAGGGAPTEGSANVVEQVGPNRLIDIFVSDVGIFVVDSFSVGVFNRFGTKILGQEMPREVTAAAFDGELLVIADGAKLTTYDLGLQELVSVNLVESCASAVMISGGRFVCGPQNDWDRIFYTYDARTGDLLASSTPYTYHGIPMRRIPGTDDFVTVSNTSSPSEFWLYSVLPSEDEVKYVNESPYHGDFRVTKAYAFDGAPPEHLVTDEGLMLNIYGENCTAESSSLDAGCFVKAGAVGTLTGSQVFIAMDSDDAGNIYGLVSFSTSSTRACEDGCLIEAVDVSERSIKKQLTVHDPLSWGAVIKRDSTYNGVVVAGQNGGDTFAEEYPGYLVKWYSLD
jgi:hypothetical protein